MSLEKDLVEEIVAAETKEIEKVFNSFLEEKHLDSFQGYQIAMSEPISQVEWCPRTETFYSSTKINIRCVKEMPNIPKED